MKTTFAGSPVSRAPRCRFRAPAEGREVGTMCAVETRPRIGTDRLVLRAPQSGDALMLADFGNDIGVAGMTASMPHPFSVDDAEACLAKAAGGDPRKRAGFVIEHRQFGPIGLLQIHEKEPRRPE